MHTTSTHRFFSVSKTAASTSALFLAIASSMTERPRRRASASMPFSRASHWAAFSHSSSARWKVVESNRTYTLGYRKWIVGEREGESGRPAQVMAAVAQPNGVDIAAHVLPTSFDGVASGIFEQCCFANTNQQCAVPLHCSDGVTTKFRAFFFCDRKGRSSGSILTEISPGDLTWAHFFKRRVRRCYLYLYFNLRTQTVRTDWPNVCGVTALSMGEHEREHGGVNVSRPHPTSLTTEGIITTTSLTPR